MRYLSGDPPLRPVQEKSPIPFSDVPTGRVRAMGVTAGIDEHSLFRPYIYRGIGIDIYDLPRPRPWPEFEKRKPRKPRKKQAPKFDTRPRLHYRPEPKPEGPIDISRPETWGNRGKVRPKYEKPKPKCKVSRNAPVRPAPGWKPTTGEDIDQWLAEYE